MTQHVTVHWHSCWALLFHLQEATHKNAQRKLTNARCPDHALCRTRSAHAGAGMLFNVQRSQEFIFCLAENHFHDESSLGLSMDLACHLELSELRAHRTTPRMSATAWPHLRSMPPPRPRPGRRKQRPWRPAHGKHLLISWARVGLISCANAGTCTATIAGSVHNPTAATVRYQDKPRHTQRPRTRKSVSIEQRV